MPFSVNDNGTGVAVTEDTTVRVNVGGEWKRAGRIQKVEGGNAVELEDIKPATPIDYPMSGISNNLISYYNTWVQWEVPDEGAPDNYYIVEAYRHNSSGVREASPFDTQIVDANGAGRIGNYVQVLIGGLQPSTKYSFDIRGWASSGKVGDIHTTYWETGRPQLTDQQDVWGYNLGNLQYERMRNANWLPAVSSHDNASYPLANAFDSNDSNVFISGIGRSSALWGSAGGYSYWKASSDYPYNIYMYPRGSYRLVKRLDARIYGATFATNPEYGYDVWDSATSLQLGMLRHSSAGGGAFIAGSAQSKATATPGTIAATPDTHVERGVTFSWDGLNRAVSPADAGYLADSGGTSRYTERAFYLHYYNTNVPYVGNIYGNIYGPEAHRGTLVYVDIWYYPWEPYTTQTIVTQTQQNGFVWA